MGIHKQQEHGTQFHQEPQIRASANDLRNSQEINREILKNFNEESMKLFQDMQSNPLTNLSPDTFQGQSAQELIKKLSSNTITERMDQRMGQQPCKCRIEKDNFKLIIKAKSLKIISFLNLIDNFYTKIMKNEQLNGRNFTRLGHPSIQIIGQFNELVLLKDSVFDDHQFMTASKIQLKGHFAFCKWKLIRKVFNEMGVCHVENALFYKQGVLANISALNETVNIKVKQFAQKHLVLCEELDLSEKKLTKIRNDYAKDSKIVDECIQSYTKASQSINNYQKQLELEMKFKLSYKKMQDTASQVSDALDSLCETRDKFQNQTQEMIRELWSLDRNKTEIFKSTIMSVVDTYHEFESQIQTYFEECIRQSNQNQKNIILTLNSQKLSSSKISRSSEVSSGQESNSEEEEKFFDKQRKRSIKYKKEDVQKFMDQLGIEEIQLNSPIMSRDHSVGAISRNTIGPKEMRRDYSVLSAKGDDQQDHQFQGSDDDFSEENFNMSAIDQQNMNVQKLPHEYQYSPQRDKPQSKQKGNIIIFKQDEIEKQEFSMNLISSPKSQTSTQNDSVQDIAIIEVQFNQYQQKYQENNRQTNLIMQGAKDFSQYMKYMQTYIRTYHKHLQTIIEEQYEDATHITNESQEQTHNGQSNMIQQTVKKVRQLKIKKENNDMISRIWMSLINNFKSYVNQYEQLSSRIQDLSQTMEQFIVQTLEKKNQITENIKAKQSSIRKLIAESKSLAQQIKQISHMQHNEKNSTQDIAKISTYKQYIQSYQSIKQKYLPSNISLSKLQNEQLSQEDYEQLQKMLPIKYQKLSQVQSELKTIIKEYHQLLKSLEPIKSQAKEKIIDIKSELMISHQERSKNSQTFFKNLIESIEQSLFTEMENSAEDGREDYSSNILSQHQDSGSKIYDVVFHKKECMYYNPQDLKSGSQEKSNSVSPAKKSISRDDNDIYSQNANQIEGLQEERLYEFNSTNVLNRNRSKSAYKPQNDNQIQDFLPNLLNNDSQDQMPKKHNYSFNFGKQVNIINNFNSNRSSFDQNPPQDPQINNSSQKGLESANWFNKALSVFYQEWKSSQVFQNFILKEIYLVANKGRPKVLSEIEVHKVTLHGKAPEFQKIQKLDSHPDDFLHDIDLSLRGTVEVLIKTEINIDWGLQNYYKIPITVNILLRSINGKIRVFYSNDKTKGSWYGFVGKPVIKLNLDPVIGKDNRFSIKYIPKLRELIEDLIGKRFDKYCLPNKRPLSIPAHTYEEFVKGGLQAVIIAESFQNKFKPVSHEKLKCLFPLANVPMLHYVIEFLLMNKVTEIFIAVCIHRSQIDKFLNAQKYKGVKINVITLESSANLGDALREVNQLQTIQHEFILCRGDIITNVNIHQAMKEHFKIKAEDKEKKLVLTKLFVKVPFSNPIRNKQQEVALILDDQTKEIMKYESFINNKSLKINEEYISMKQSQRKYQIRFDLVDSEISICSRDVLNYFTDNFDYENLNDDFINQIQSSEIIEDRIIAYEMNGYFARILDPRTYAEVTQDILSRFLHPFVIDSKLLFPNSNYHFQSFNKYLEGDVQIGLGSTISNNCQVAKGSKIGNHTAIDRSTIGKNCHIGNNVTIRNSFIWNDVKIHDGFKEDQTIQAGSMVSKYTYNSKTLKFEESEKNQSEIFEVGCISYLPRECQLKEDEIIGSKHQQEDEESDFEDEEDHEEQKSNEAFLNEVKKTIERTTDDQISNAVTEVKSLRMSYNKDQSDCIEAFIPPLLDKITEENLQKRSKQLQDLFTNWKDLLVEFMRADADEKTFIQFSLIRAIEIYCATHELFNNTFHIIMQIIFQHKFIEGGIFIKWNQQAQKSIQNLTKEDEIQDDIFDFIESSKREKFIKDMAKFIEFLEKSLEEGEEEEEEYDEEEGAEEEEEEEEEEDQ
eukprot:403340855